MLHLPPVNIPHFPTHLPGTSLRYKPGFIHGGPGIEHDCGTSRGVGYYLEPLALLALFGRSPLSASLRGVTNGGPDPGVDVFRAVTLPLLRQLAGLEDGLELRIEARGAPPLGGGEVRLRLPCVKALPPVALTDEGMVRRVRGVAHSMRVSPQAANRLVDGARGVMNKVRFRKGGGAVVACYPGQLCMPRGGGGG